MLQRILSGTANVLVLGSLSGIAWWGHETDWTFWHRVPHGPVERIVHPSIAATAKAPSTASPAGSGHSPSIDFGEQVVSLSGEVTLEQLGIRLGEVACQPVSESLTVPGQVKYVETQLAQLSARVPGMVWSIHKRVGDPVTQGEVLAILDSSEVGRAKAEFLQSLVQTELRQKNLQRIIDMAESLPERQRREAEAAYREACVQRYNAQQALVNLGLPIRIRDLEGLTDQQRAERIHFLGLPSGLTGQFDAEVVTANLIPLVAPFDGVLIRQQITRGEIVNPQQPQMTVADVRKMWVELSVHKEDSARVRIGQPISFEADGLAQPVSSHISWMSTEADAVTRTVRVIAEVDNQMVMTASSTLPRRALEANVFGTGQIRIRETAQALVVPRSAVVWIHQQPVVFVPLFTAGQIDGPKSVQPPLRFVARPVKTGSHSETGSIELLQGVQPGEKIVCEGSHLLKSELLLKPTPASPHTASPHTARQDSPGRAAQREPLPQRQ